MCANYIEKKNKKHWAGIQKHDSYARSTRMRQGTHPLIIIIMIELLASCRKCFFFCCLVFFLVFAADFHLSIHNEIRGAKMATLPL